MVKLVCQLMATAVLACLFVSCSGVTNAPIPDASQGAETPGLAERSQDVLDLHSNADEPGCSAAVGREGEVLWQGVQGLADLRSGTTITPETVFDIGSVTKQFTAAAILLLADAGRLRLEDPLSKYMLNFPSWSKKTTLEHLMHHTSGIPNYEPLLQAQGHELTDRTTQRQAVKVLSTVQRLEFSPGSDWAYSNSNYVLLAEVVRIVSDETLPRYLQTKIFDPLGLDMVVDPVGVVPNKAVSYHDHPSSGQDAPNFSVADYRWEQVGDGGIQTTPTELVRWADNYRTGNVGGPDWKRAVLAGAVDVPPGPTGSAARYGAGIFEIDDRAIGHQGGWEGFVTDFWVSPSRSISIAVSCNKTFNSGDIVESLYSIGEMRESLVSIWSPS